MTKYESVSNDIRKKIEDGTYKKNEYLPAEPILCEEYGCSKQTIKKALEILVFDGIIHRQRGKGTIVKPAFDLIKGEQHSNYIKGSYRTFNESFDVKSKVIFLNIINPDKNISSKLGISEEDFVYHFKRVRYIDSEPTTIQESYVPVTLIPGLKRSHLEKSFFSYIEDDLNLKIKSIQQKIIVAKADLDSEKYLDLKKDDPVAVIESVHYLSTGEVFEYVIFQQSYKHFVYHSIQTKP